MVIAIQCRRIPCNPAPAIVEIFDRVYNIASWLFHCGSKRCAQVVRISAVEKTRGEAKPSR